MRSALLCALAALVWFNPTCAARARDALVTHASKPASNVVLITIGQDREHGQATRLVERLKSLGARSIVIAGELPASDDPALVDAVTRAGCVIVTAPSFDALRRAARASGAARVRPDADGVVRRVPLDGERPHLAAVAAGVHRAGEPMFRVVPRVPTIPLMAALLEGHDDALRKQIAGRIAVIELARKERWPVQPGGALVGAGWLTAAWIELLLAGDLDEGLSRALMPLALLALALYSSRFHTGST